MERLRKLSRRDFLKLLGFTAVGAVAGGCRWSRRLAELSVKPEATATGTPTTKPTTASPEAKPSPSPTTRATETPGSTATAAIGPTETAVPEATTVPEILPAWPETPQEAAALFGASPERWEKNPEGGWHLREEGERRLIDPQGYLMEGYYDTKPGKNPLCFASAGIAIEIQGGTVWQEPGTEETAKRLQEKMAIPVWDDGKQHPCSLVLPKKN